ncbi:hypothetical protein B484DRAFT_391580, partial [Ochromonadaceae sp. CCMP2298]
MCDSYLRQAFEELFAEDGLTVMGRGLGITQLFVKFARYHASGGRKIVFCLNCAGHEEALRDAFAESATDASEMPQ